MAARTNPQPIRLLSNMFRFQPMAQRQFYAYRFDSVPELNDDQHDVRGKLLRLANETIQASIGVYKQSGLCLYALLKHTEPIHADVSLDGTDYRITLIHIKDLSFLGEDFENSKGVMQMFNVLVKRMMKYAGFVQPTQMPKMYDRSQTINIP
jgi:hypothetical protein